MGNFLISVFLQENSPWDLPQSLTSYLVVWKTEISLADGVDTMRYNSHINILKPYHLSLLVHLKYVYTKICVIHSGNNVW